MVWDQPLREPDQKAVQINLPLNSGLLRQSLRREAQIHILVLQATTRTLERIVILPVLRNYKTQAARAGLRIMALHFS
jgi:hypothetical protein